MSGVSPSYFDVAVVDVNLGSHSGYDICRYLEAVARVPVPVVLVSQDQQDPVGHWPETIREFVHKCFGPYSILDAAIEASHINEIVPK